MGSQASQVAILAQNSQRILRYAFILQFIASVPFLWFAANTGKQHVHLLLKGSNTTGTIVSVVPVQLSRGSGSNFSTTTSYEAVISFSAGENRFRFQEWKGTSISPTIGTKVQVIYDPSEPEIAMADRGYLNFLPWGPCAAIGVFLLLVALKGLLTLLLRR
jgi:hypothetical protein